MSLERILLTLCRKYEQTQCFGTVASSLSNAVWTPDQNATRGSRNTGAGRAFVGANEEVLCWDVKKGELLSRWRANDCTHEVTAIAQSKTDPDLFAIGYADGSIRLWDSKIESVIISFNGHKSGITILEFDYQGVRLASGSRDTDIIIWDLVSEVGLCKLRGHKNQITGLHFVQAAERDVDPEIALNGNGNVDNEMILNQEGELYLLSTSKDALIKLWDVASQYCVETHVTQANGECWALGVSSDDSGCVTAGNDGQMTVWALDQVALWNLSSKLHDTSMGKVLNQRGIFSRQGREQTIGIAFHPQSNYIALHGTEKAVEIWKVRTPSEIKKSLARKRKRRREKIAANGLDNDTVADSMDVTEDNEDPSTAPINEVFVPYVIVRTGGKVRSINWAGGRPKKALQLLIGSTNNQLELYTIESQEKAKKAKGEADIDYTRLFSVELPGHRTDVRAVALSSDDRMLATASNGSLKIWNIRTQSCLRTLECGYALCCAFLPGDKIVLVGNKNGQLELFDISSSSLLEEMPAHEGPVWTMAVHPDGKSIVTGSADKTAKFWNFEVVQEDIPGTKRTSPRLRLVQTRVLKVNDDVLNLCYSPDSRYLAVSTLDNTVKVFFTDSLKLFLNLYGHKLPVLNMSISSDSKLIATCSADKNVRIWGLDFGDCHKAFFAHDESIMQVSFTAHPPTREEAHLFFSASKDGLLKQWDGDKFQHIQKLSGHHGEIWAMCVSNVGDFVVTASHDKSIRVWSQTDEPLFLEEEREKELEEMYDQTLAANLERDQADEFAAAEADGETVEVAAPTKQTATTMTASEKITEALNMCTEDLDVVREHERQIATNPSGKHAKPQRHPLLAMRDVSAEAHLLSVFSSIPSSALHDALLLLSFSQLPALFVFFSIWLQKEMNIPLTCRILFFLLKTHHKQIVASRELRLQLDDMRGKLKDSLAKWKSVMGFNMAATRILGTRVAESRITTIEDNDATYESRGSGKKRTFVNVA